MEDICGHKKTSMKTLDSLGIVKYVEYSSVHVSAEDMKDVLVAKTAKESAGVNAKDVSSPVSASVKCERGHGKLYRDWYGEWVCPICGFHLYEDKR